jgi:uncharacterized protein YllA (UPF0747 family)
VARGYHAQVQAQDDAVALFHLDGGRRPIRRHGDQFVAGDETFSRAALIEQARTVPERFSPNVLLRPLVQDTLFPTICYIAGPNELAYLGQLRLIYERFGVPMPLMYSRASATLVDAGSNTSCRSRHCSRRTNRLSISCSRPRSRRASRIRSQGFHMRSRRPWAG